MLMVRWLFRSPETKEKTSFDMWVFHLLRRRASLQTPRPVKQGSSIKVIPMSLFSEQRVGRPKLPAPPSPRPARPQPKPTVLTEQDIAFAKLTGMKLPKGYD